MLGPSEVVFFDETELIQLFLLVYFVNKKRNSHNKVQSDNAYYNNKSCTHKS